MKFYPDEKGYLRTCLCKNSVSKFYLIHRLVAQTFIPNPNNLLEVNHKDGNKANNNVENLEWCNAKYNCNYGTRNQKLYHSVIRPNLSYSKHIDVGISAHNRKLIFEKYL